jgi:hypothetical protein
MNRYIARHDLLFFITIFIQIYIKKLNENN